MLPMREVKAYYAKKGTLQRDVYEKRKECVKKLKQVKEEFIRLCDYEDQIVQIMLDLRKICPHRQPNGEYAFGPDNKCVYCERSLTNMPRGPSWSLGI